MDNVVLFIAAWGISGVTLLVVVYMAMRSKRSNQAILDTRGKLRAMVPIKENLKKKPWALRSSWRVAILAVEAFFAALAAVSSGLGMGLLILAVCGAATYFFSV